MIYDRYDAYDVIFPLALMCMRTYPRIYIGAHKESIVISVTCVIGRGIHPSSEAPKIARALERI